MDPYFPLRPGKWFFYVTMVDLLGKIRRRRSPFSLIRNKMKWSSFGCHSDDEKSISFALDNDSIALQFTCCAFSVHRDAAICVLHSERDIPIAYLKCHHSRVQNHYYANTIMLTHLMHMNKFVFRLIFGSWTRTGQIRDTISKCNKSKSNRMD